MTLIVAAGLSPLLLIPPIYFVRLMADARRLRSRFVERPVEPGLEAFERQGLLIPTDYATWRTVPFSAEEASDAVLRTAGGFGRMAVPDTDALP